MLQIFSDHSMAVFISRKYFELSMFCLDLCVCECKFRKSYLLRYYVMQNCKQLQIPTWIHALTFLTTVLEVLFNISCSPHFPLWGILDKSHHTYGIWYWCQSINVSLHLPTFMYSMRTCCISLSKLTIAFSYWSAIRKHPTRRASPTASISFGPAGRRYHFF